MSHDEPDYSVDPRSLAEEERDAMREQMERDDRSRAATSVMDWQAAFLAAMRDQLAGDHVVEDAGHAAMLSGWTPQRFATEIATRLQESLKRRPLAVLRG
jgi:hypothetical protein